MSELNLNPNQPATPDSAQAHHLHIILDFIQATFHFEWVKKAETNLVARGMAWWQPSILYKGSTLSWQLQSLHPPGPVQKGWFSNHASSIRSFVTTLQRWLPVHETAIRFHHLSPQGFPPPHCVTFDGSHGPWEELRNQFKIVLQLTRVLLDAPQPVPQAERRPRLGHLWFQRILPPQFHHLIPPFGTPPTPLSQPASPASPASPATDQDTRTVNFHSWLLEDRQIQEKVALIRTNAARFRQREQERIARRNAARQRASASSPTTPTDTPTPTTPHSPSPSTPPPPVEVPTELEPLRLQFQPDFVPLTHLNHWFLRERALQWWVSNQSDDLLCLPLCRIQHLEYQIRTALRVLGPLRGRALLSDEVGLGKTIEAGLILREYVTRGMVRRFLVLTQPSLVDQWAEELSEKFDLTVATTNDNTHANPNAFWRQSNGIVASLHTLKQTNHLAVAREVPWDLLIVDEAHHLRNPASLAWQAVNVLPRQFLLLLTATPVQNSLEELYHLVTLLQPGQLPSPREFRQRFIDPKRPRQPREADELRRLLQQVMIRNTRSSAGVALPHRRAHSVLFQPSPAEQTFWSQWESDFRQALTRLPPAQASLWGRLVLQAAGSSPHAWRSSLEKFPDPPAARQWCATTPPDHGWLAKCQLLPPLAQIEGGVVVFTQFLATQAALADFLRAAHVPITVLNGQTPAAQREPLVQLFKREGGVLLLSRSGTEGRNLQFSCRLVNFDLPWNPMEIEQRIGRLHRLGQTRPVHIHNFVAEGTLQQHLLDLLQDKLNLFELVVGETGLILGDRLAGDEFADVILQHWREADAPDHLRAAFERLGDQITAARDGYRETKELDETLFADDYESL